MPPSYDCEDAMTHLSQLLVVIITISLSQLSVGRLTSWPSPLQLEIRRQVIAFFFFMSQHTCHSGCGSFLLVVSHYFQKHIKFFSWWKYKIRSSCINDRSYSTPLAVLRSHSLEQWWRENPSKSETRSESTAVQGCCGAAANSSTRCDGPSGHH